MIGKDAYLANIPLLHSWDGGATWNAGGFGPRELGFLIDLVGSPENRGHPVIETGAGNSTIAFLLGGASVVRSICPEPSLFQRVRAYCAANGIDARSLEAVEPRSEEALPAVAAACAAGAERHAVGLIDGGHGWPTVFVDLCYMNAALAQGGYLILDDLQLYSVAEAFRFLCEDPGFELVERMPKTAAFRKLYDFDFFKEFGAQPYILRRSEEFRGAG